MRIAISPTLRIAAGLLLAALLSIVGYQVFRRWISHGPEALLKQADDLSWLENWTRVQILHAASRQGLISRTCSQCSRAQQWAERPRIHQISNLDQELLTGLCGRLSARPTISFAHFCTEHSASELSMTD
jgi:hypothetical protein